MLALAAGLLKHSCRSTDVVARYGGEEFAVILPETGIGGALVLAERLRDTVAKHAFMVGKNILHVTVSLGVACCPQHADNQSALIKAADAAMYISKAKGRNCVTAASGPAE